MRPGGCRPEPEISETIGAVPAAVELGRRGRVRFRSDTCAAKVVQIEVGENDVAHTESCGTTVDCCGGWGIHG